MAATLKPMLYSRHLSGLLRAPCKLSTPLRLVYGLRSLSASFPVSKDPNTPRKAGDKGPGKNYCRKVAKKAKALPEEGGEGGGGLDSLLMSMQHMEGTSEQEAGGKETPDLMNILSGIKVVSTGGESQRRRTESSAVTSCQFLDPTAGPRLELFYKPKAGVPIKPPGKPTYAEIEEREKIKDLLMLRPWSHYNDVLENRGIPFPRQFPIDNENYDQGDEVGVGFEDHVLLDHLLTELPKKGPVRHFMELVVTGLSKNPHYTAEEKKEMVAWYKNYFDSFTAEQLQAI